MLLFVAVAGLVGSWVVRLQEPNPPARYLSVVWGTMPIKVPRHR